MLHTLLSTALLLTPMAPTQEPFDTLFSPASGPLTLEVNEDGESISYFDLLRLYSELTGQYVTYAFESLQVALTQRVRLDRAITIAPNEVQLFVETLLLEGDYVLQPVKTSGVHVVAVTSLTTSARNNIRSKARYIAEDQLETIRRHPAVLFMSAITLPNMDVRHASNSMRTMITDANTQQILPVGSTHTMLVVGFGDQLATIADILRAADSAAAKHAASATAYAVVRLEKATAGELAPLLDRAVGGPRRPGATTPDKKDKKEPVTTGRDLRVLADVRTNSLVIAGPRSRVDSLKQLIALLDV